MQFADGLVKRYVAHRDQQLVGTRERHPRAGKSTGSRLRRAVDSAIAHEQLPVANSVITYGQLPVANSVITYGQHPVANRGIAYGQHPVANGQHPGGRGHVASSGPVGKALQANRQRRHQRGAQQFG